VVPGRPIGQNRGSDLHHLPESSILGDLTKLD
jgi:hypothetical protein